MSYIDFQLVPASIGPYRHSFNPVPSSSIPYTSRFSVLPTSLRSFCFSLAEMAPTISPYIHSYPLSSTFCLRNFPIFSILALLRLAHSMALLPFATGSHSIVHVSTVVITTNSELLMCAAQAINARQILALCDAYSVRDTTGVNFQQRDCERFWLQEKIHRPIPSGGIYATKAVAHKYMFRTRASEVERGTSADSSRLFEHVLCSIWSGHSLCSTCL